MLRFRDVGGMGLMMQYVGFRVQHVAFRTWGRALRKDSRIHDLPALNPKSKS